MTQPCMPLEPLMGLTGKDMIENITRNAVIYHDCSDKVNTLIGVVKTK